MKKAPNPPTRNSIREPWIGASMEELRLRTDPVRIMFRESAMAKIEPSAMGPKDRMVVHLASLNARGRRAPDRRQRMAPSKNNEE